MWISNHSHSRKQFKGISSMKTGFVVTGLCCSVLPSLLLTTSMGLAAEANGNAVEQRETIPLRPPVPTVAIQCRFIRNPQDPPHQSTCIAEYLAAGFYRQIGSCRGLNSCTVTVGPYRPTRVWSPDSRYQFSSTAPILPANVSFPIFARKAQVTKGPWISAASTNRMVVRWETDGQATAWLRVVNDQFTPPHSSRWIQGNSSCPDGPTERCMHTVIVTGLTANQRYRFVLGDVVPNPTNGLHLGGNLTTEPAAGSAKEYSFSVLGDVQGADFKAWTEVSKYTSALQSATGRSGGPVLHTGDFTLTQLKDDRFFTLGRSMLSSYPFFPAIGNGDDESLFLRYFGPTGRTSLTDFDKGLKTYYSLNYGKTHFIFLDTNTLTSCSDAQAAWLRADVNGSSAMSADHIVVVAHKGPRSNGVYGDNAVLKSCLISLFKDPNGQPSNLFRKLRIVFSGHQHDYERIIMAHTVGSETRSVHYVTVGSAGADPRCPVSLTGMAASSAAICKNPPYDPTFDYQGLVVDVRGQVFELRAYNFAFNDAGQMVPQGNPAKMYSIIDCFAMDQKGATIAPENSCKP